MLRLSAGKELFPRSATLVVILGSASVILLLHVRSQIKLVAEQAQIRSLLPPHAVPAKMAVIGHQRAEPVWAKRMTRWCRGTAMYRPNTLIRVSWDSLPFHHRAARRTRVPSCRPSFWASVAAVKNKYKQLKKGVYAVLLCIPRANRT